MDKKTSQQIRLQMILKKYGNLGPPINDLKPSLENLTYLKSPTTHSRTCAAILILKWGSKKEEGKVFNTS
jgi:hypothetical protein